MAGITNPRVPGGRWEFILSLTEAITLAHGLLGRLSNSGFMMCFYFATIAHRGYIRQMRMENGD